MTAPCFYCGSARTCSHRIVDPPRIPDPDATIRSARHGRKNPKGKDGPHKRRDVYVSGGGQYRVSKSRLDALKKHGEAHV